MFGYKEKIRYLYYLLARETFALLHDLKRAILLFIKIDVCIYYAFIFHVWILES